MRRIRTLAGVAAMALVIATGAACGSGGDEADAPTTAAFTAAEAPAAPPPTTEAPVTTATTTTAPATTAPRPRPRPRPEPAPEPLPGLPEYTAGFEEWLRLNAEPIPPDSADSQVVGFDAHRSTKQVYVNRTRAQLTGPGGAQRLPYPDGTIILKTGTNGDTITLIAVMRKIAGSDPEHGDWEYIEWKRSSSAEPFATNSGLQDATCWGCHGLVQDDDWVFTGLE